MATDSAPALQLAQHFLIAMPGMEDDAFAGSVVYICEHGPEGSLGLCINKTVDGVLLDDLFDTMGLPLHRPDLAGSAVLWGGPVQPERGFVLHHRLEDPDSTLSRYTSSLSLPDGLQVTTSRDILQDMAEGGGPPQLLFTLGYAAWDGGQLEDELLRNSWLTVAASADVLFDTPLEQRYDRALALLGIQSWMLSSAAGSA